MPGTLTCPDCGHTLPRRNGGRALLCPACGRAVVDDADAEHIRPQPASHPTTPKRPRDEGRPSRPTGALSRGLVANDDVHGLRKPRSILRENLLFFAVFIPLALLGGGVI